ncbi:MAG: hypothetical protein CVV06_00315 [Gammaproteobacteria bacterium HGW-Gammaproteobacteria-10]|nr:MAG: hypothetical protein CVV06_00315 [Gammaproteobacteria bacterium HGW-Gammaproteobacteria-10]
MKNKKVAATVSIALLGSIGADVANAVEGTLMNKDERVIHRNDTMIQLIDALYENGSIDSKTYGALRASAQGDTDAKLHEIDETEKVVQAVVDKSLPKPQPNDVKVMYKNGFRMQSTDGEHAMELHGRIQADYLDTISGDRETKDKFNIRRAYIYMQGYLYKNWEYLFVGAFQGNPQLIWAEINAHLWDEVQFKFGHLRFPFSVNESTSSRNIDFMARALPMQFIPGLDRGAMLHGHPTTGLYYAAGVVNGGLRNNVGLSSTGLDEDNDVDGKDFLGHISYNLAPVLGHEDNVYHVGFSYATGKQPTGPEGNSSYRLRASTETEQIRFFEADQFGSSSVDLERIGVSTVLAHGPMRFTGEYVKNTFEGRAAGNDFSRDIDAYYLSAHWLLTGESYAKAFSKQNSLSDIIPTRNFDMKGGWGAWELAFRFSHLDASDFKTTNAEGAGRLRKGFANGADGYTVGLKWIINPQVRFLANYVHTEFNQPITVNGATINSEDGLNGRVQINF